MAFGKLSRLLSLRSGDDMDALRIYHNSYSLKFRKPFGAVCCRQTVLLNLLTSVIPDDIYVRLWQEEKGEKCARMQYAGRQGEEYEYTAQVTAPAEPTVLWYFFVIIKNNKTFYYGNNQARTGGIGSIYEILPPSYQITVHLEQAKTPRWLKEGVIYQIFVDRFYNGKCQAAVNSKTGAVLHLDWDGPPYYIKDAKTGQIVFFDYFGGNLAGIRAKLPYLKELGVSILYFNPIFEANSNHKYDTGDYTKIDPMYGDEDEIALLCRECQEAGINIILDGVFSHTGSDSIYFNKNGRYQSLGAYQSVTSPYYPWYRFIKHPTQYESWWGIDSLPNVNELEPSFLDYIINDPDSVVAKWLKYGIKGWRLDVADELPDEFIRLLRRRIKALDANSILLGEVWEDASHKISYGAMRHYFGGEELDSVMNYPFREITLDFILGRKSARQMHDALCSLYENYPKEVFFSAMNLVGSHDVPRILTLLGEAPPAHLFSAYEQAQYRLSDKDYHKAVMRLKILLLWQMTFPGVPAIYYGDEAGVEGYSDPFNRGTYPWGKEDQELLFWYKKMIMIRNHNPVLKTGEWVSLYAQGDVYCYMRLIEDGKDAFGRLHDNSVAIIAFNRSLSDSYNIIVETGRWGQQTFYDMLEDRKLEGDKLLPLNLPPLGAKLLINKPIFPAKQKASGILLPVSCLPSIHGIGDLGVQAYCWVDFLGSAKQKLWQVLPLNPPGFGESPYQALSAFAGNYLFLSLERLREAGLLRAEEISQPPSFAEHEVEYSKVRHWKEPLLYIAFKRFKTNGKYQEFVQKNQDWLYDYAFFMALKQYFGGKPWYEWDADIAFRKPQAYEKYASLLREQIEYHHFLQYAWDVQWQALKAYANRTGIKIIGDLPLFIAHDSSDVWSRPDLFKLDNKGYPTKVAGVPPDYFSQTGQLWGNPVYRWDIMAKEDFNWWCRRVAQLAKWVDIIRLDHFRGYQAYWQVDFGAKTAEKGEWTEGPGLKLFQAVERHVGTISYIAENLGVITDDVEELRQILKLPGMSVLQFDLQDDGLVFPDSNDIVLYTGTHDNDTILGWFKSLSKRQGQHFKMLWDTSNSVISSYFIKLLLQSPAKTVIFPLQDILGLGSEARFNIPGTVGTNWRWRLAEQPLPHTAKRLADLVLQHNR